MRINVSTATGKITNLFMMLLNETISDIFYDQPEIYLKCIKAGAKYLKEEPYPENNQDIKFKYGYHPEKVTNREEWWTDALKPIKAELKDHYGPGFTKKIKGIVWTLADEGNTALENMKQFISTGTCEQYEAFIDGTPNNSDAGGLYIDGETFEKPICIDCGAPLTKEEVETYGDTCEACALDDIGRNRNYDGPDVGDLFESTIKEGTNTKKKNYIDTKGEKAPLDWDRIDDKIEKVGFGKDLYEMHFREDIESWYEPFRSFCYQIYNGGVSQPLGLNPHYCKDICTLLDKLPSGGIMEKIYLEKNIPDEWAPILEKFVKEVCELCDAVSETEFYKDCDWCGGSGEEYITEEDEDGDEYSYYDTCDRCDGTGFLRCSIDNMDNIDDAKLCLSTIAQGYWDDLDDNVLEYCEMFKAIEGGE